jgi:hypothetical protein
VYGNETFIVDLCIPLYFAEAVSFFYLRTNEDNDDRNLAEQLLFVIQSYHRYVCTSQTASNIVGRLF